MIVLDNLIFSLQRAGGISNVWAMLIKHLLTVGDFSSSLRFLEYKYAENNLFRQEIDIPEKLIIRRKSTLPQLELLKPVYFHSSADKLIFHSPYYRHCNNPNAINISTVHDFIYERIPSSRNISSHLQCFIKRRAIRNADKIVCVSSNTCQDLLDLHPEIGPQKITVIHNAVNPEFHPLIESKGCRKDTIVFIGTRTRYKNFDFAIKAANLTGLRLTICGAVITKGELRKLSKSGIRFESVVRPTIEQMNQIYNNAFMLVYPSEYEGFGIPVIEAQASGCPVVALNKSSIPEIGGEDNSIILLNSFSTDELMNAMKILDDESSRNRLIINGIKNAQRFSAQTMEQQYVALYKKVLEP